MFCCYSKKPRVFSPQKNGKKIENLQAAHQRGGAKKNNRNVI